MALVRLQHRAPALRTYEIPVEHGGGEVHHLGRVTRDPKTGEAGVRLLRAILPTSITLTARDTTGDMSEPMDEAVLKAPQIAAAIAAKLIVALPVPVDAAPPAASAPAPEQAAPATPVVAADLPLALAAPPSKPLVTTPKNRTAPRPEQE